MGYYIETPSPKGKANFLVEAGGAIKIAKPTSFDPPAGQALICVVDNNLFEAAAICYNDREFKDFSDPSDPRPSTWLLMDKDKVLMACPEASGVLG